MSWSCDSSRYDVRWVDFNGDNVTDVVCTDTTLARVWVATLNGNQFIPINNQTDPVGVSEGYIGELPMGGCGSGYWLTWADFDGDGKGDAICFKASNGQTWVSVSTGTGVAAINSNVSPGGSYPGYVGSVWSCPTIYWGDFDGDGKADGICYDRSYGHTWVAKSTGGAITPINTNTGGGSSQGYVGQVSSCSSSGNNVYTVDFNNDGYTDIVCSKISNGLTWVYKSTGTAITYYNGNAHASYPTSYGYVGSILTCNSKLAWVNYNDTELKYVCMVGSTYTISSYNSQPSGSPSPPSTDPVIVNGPSPTPMPYTSGTSGGGGNTGGVVTGTNDDSESGPSVASQVWFQALLSIVGGLFVTVCGGAIVNRYCAKKSDPIGITLIPGKDIEIIDYSVSKVFFDYGDGPSKTSWVGPNDALLVYDYDGSRVVNESKKIVLTSWAEGSRTDFEALLKKFDSNGDAVFDSRDEEFNKFLVWQDKNQDGISEPSELNNLIGSGIKKIDFNKVQKSSIEEIEKGNLNSATVHWDDGSLTKAYDLVLTHD